MIIILMNKHVTYLDKEGKWRTEKVIENSDDYFIVENIFGRRRRVHKDRIKKQF